MSGVLLFEDSPLVVSPSLASIIKQLAPKSDACGCAIVLQQVHYYVHKQSGRVVDGVRWIFNTYDQWMNSLSWLSKWQVRKLFHQLRKLGLLLFEKLDAQDWNQRGYYRIDYERLKALQLSMCGMPTHRCVAVPHIDVWPAHTSDTETSTKSSTNTCEVKIFETEEEATKEEEVISDQPTSEEIHALETELRKLRINSAEVAIAVRKHWENAAHALHEVKRECSEGWVKKPIARFLQHLKSPVRELSAAAPAPKKEFPKPTPEQECELRENFGRLTDVSGFVGIYAGSDIIPWWEALSLKLEDLHE